MGFRELQIRVAQQLAAVPPALLPLCKKRKEATIRNTETK